MENQKKSFALGYSLILHSCITYILYATIGGSGLSTIVAFFSEKTGLNAATVTSVNTYGGILASFAVFFMGRVVSRYGVRLVTTISLFIGGASMFLLAHGNTLAIYILVSIITQLTINAYCFTGTGTLITSWYPRTKGFIMGWTTTGIMISAFTGIAFISAFTPRIGFSATMSIVGGFMILFGIASWFWVRNSPEEVGLLPDNKPVSAEEKAFLGSGGQKLDWSIKDLLLSKDGFLICLSLGLACLCTSGVAITFIPTLMELGYERMTAVGIFGIVSLISCLGSIILGWVDEKYGTRRGIFIFFGFYIAGFFAAYFLQAPVSVIIAMTIAYFASGAFQNLTASLMGSMYGRDNYARVWSVLYTVIWMIRCLAFLAIGIIISTFGGYKQTLIFFAVLSVIAMFVFIPINTKYRVAPKLR